MEETAKELMQKMLEMPLEFTPDLDLSKREIFASEIMCALLLKPEVSTYQSNKVLEEKFERVASLSVIAAEKLIKALNKQP